MSAWKVLLIVVLACASSRSRGRTTRPGIANLRADCRQPSARCWCRGRTWHTAPDGKRGPPTRPPLPALQRLTRPPFSLGRPRFWAPHRRHGGPARTRLGQRRPSRPTATSGTASCVTSARRIISDRSPRRVRRPCRSLDDAPRLGSHSDGPSAAKPHPRDTTAVRPASRRSRALSGWAATSVRRPARTMGWASATRTVTGCW